VTPGPRRGPAAARKTRPGKGDWTFRDWIRQFRQSGEVVAKPNASPAEQLEEARAAGAKL